MTICRESGIHRWIEQGCGQDVLQHLWVNAQTEVRHSPEWIEAASHVYVLAAYDECEDAATQLRGQLQQFRQIGIVVCSGTSLGGMPYRCDGL